MVWPSWETKVSQVSSLSSLTQAETEKPAEASMMGAEAVALAWVVERERFLPEGPSASCPLSTARGNARPLASGTWPSLMDSKFQKAINPEGVPPVPLLVV